MIFHLFYYLIGLPCMACLQSMFAVLLPAKTWQIRRLQSYVLLISGAGLGFVALAGVFFWLAASLATIAAPAVVGYVLLLIGGWVGRWVEEESKVAIHRNDRTLSPPKSSGL